MSDRPGPLGVIMTAMPGRHAEALAVLGALREAGCLRSTPADWPPVPPDGVVVADVRLVDYLDSNGSAMFGIRYDDSMSYTQALGLFTMASETVLATWRANKPT